MTKKQLRKQRASQVARQAAERMRKRHVHTNEDVRLYDRKRTRKEEREEQ